MAPSSCASEMTPSRFSDASASTLRPAAITRFAPRMPRHLNRQLARYSRRSQDQNRFTCRQSSAILDRKPRRHPGIGNRRCLNIINVVGQLQAPRMWGNGSLTHRSPRHPGKPKIDAAAIFECPHAIDARNRRDFALARIMRAARQSFYDRMQSRGPHIDQGFALFGLRLREILIMRRLPQFVHDSCFHNDLPRELKTAGIVLLPGLTLPDSSLKPQHRRRHLQYAPQFDESLSSRDNRRVASLMWACGAAGSALPWHGRGHRFDPDQVHQKPTN